MVRVPWLGREGRNIPGNISQIDLVPTLLDLMGQKVPDHLQGRSRAGVLRGEETLDGNDVFVQHNGAPVEVTWIPGRRLVKDEGVMGNDEINRMNELPWRSIVTSDRWKLNLCAGDRCELFDLNTDPCEMTNLYDDAGQQDRVRRMAARIRVWQQRTGDTARLPSM